MIIEKVIAQMERHSGSFVTLDEMIGWMGPMEYSELCGLVQQLMELDRIRPVGSRRDTNGMVPPLRLRYRIVREAVNYDQSILEITQLSPLLNISGYLKNPKLYERHRALLLPLSQFLKRRAAELEWPMSKNERAFSIWNHEKQMDDSLCQGMLRFNGMESRLNVYPTPEPFFDYLFGDRIRTLLLLENKDTWYTLRRLFLQNPEKHRLFDVPLDGVVLGEGRKATRPNALEEYAMLLQAAPLRILYFGDLDYAGIDIFQAVVEKNPSLEISLFLPAYRAMLERGQTVGRGNVHAEQTKSARLSEFLSLFRAEEADEIEKLLAEGFFLPQEILNYPYLEQQLSGSGDGHV